jgi:hypothetical protein
MNATIQMQTSILGLGLTVKLVNLSATTYPSNNAFCLLAHLDLGDDVEAVPVSINLAHGQALESHQLPDGCFFANHDNLKLTDEIVRLGLIERANDIPDTKSGYVMFKAYRLTMTGKEQLKRSISKCPDSCII